jgi:hypothetical protein
VLLKSAADVKRYAPRPIQDAAEDAEAWPRLVTPDYWSVMRADF